MTTILLLSTLILPLFVSLLWHRASQRSRHTYPPGPKGLPLLGNLFDFPTARSYAAFAKMGEQHGGGQEMVYLSALGQKMLVLNNAKHAEELFEKRSRIYSDRPVLMMAGRLVGWEGVLGLVPYNENCVDQRKRLAQFMGSRKRVEVFHQLFESETLLFLQRILSAPRDWVQHAKDWAGAIVLMSTYGYRAKQNDWFVKLVDNAMDAFSETTVPNAFLVDLVPALRFVPSWFPGAGWKRKAKKYRRYIDGILSEPYNWVKQQMAAGTAIPCFLTENLENSANLSQKERRNLQWAAVGIYTGGADTSVSVIEGFVLAMTIHTSIQKKVQEEMDRVLGHGVLPTLADRPRLPYLQATFSEAMRLYVVAPLGLPHATLQDDVYDGYFVPKGTTVIANIWKYLRDPNTYKDPEVFNPERFMGDRPEKDVLDYYFGFGRRRCPGVYFADASVWIACASLIAAFDVLPSVNAEGKPIPPRGKMVDGTVSHPEPFQSSILPRPGFEAVIRAAPES